MNHSEQVNRLRQRYGGSDRAAPFFRNPEYVRYNSLSKARDLGISKGFLWEASGQVGGITGTNTLFYRFTTTTETRIGARRLTGSPYSDADVRVSLADSDLAAIALGEDGYGWQATPTASQIIELPPIIQYLGYVDDGFWGAGFAEYDSTVIATPYIATLAAGDSLEDFAKGSPWAKVFPPGTYYLIISTDQWQAQEFRVQLAALSALELTGEIPLQFSPQGRTGATQTRGELDLALEPWARFVEFTDCSADGDLRFSLSASLAITTPSA